MMSSLQKITAALVLGLSLAACKKNQTEVYDPVYLDELAADTYYPNDILNANHNGAYGKWKVYATSGGFTGGGYTADFEYLVLKPNGIFGLLRHDSLMAFGKISINNQTATELYVDFEADAQSHHTAIHLLQDPEKYIVRQGTDSLHLNAPCCDRFDTHLKRM